MSVFALNKARLAPALLLTFAALCASHQARAAFEDAAEKSITIGFNSPVVVRYGDVVITQQDLETHLMGLPEDGRQELVSNPEMLAGALANIYLAQAFYHRATEAGLLEDPGIQSQIYSSLAREIRNLYRAWFMANIDEHDHSDRARELFLTRPDRFRGPETIDMEHIVVPARGAQEEVVAMSRILELYQKVEAGMSFSEVHAAMEENERARSGPVMLEGIATNELLPQIGALLAQVRPGTLAPPVRSQFGWHLIRPIALNEGEQLAWEEAEGLALRMAREEHRTLAWERYLRDLQDTRYEFPEGAIADLRASFGVTTAPTAEEQSELEFYLTRDPEDD